jgi:hypothetical protein
MRKATLAVASFLGLALLMLVQAPASVGRTVAASPDALLKTRLRNLVMAQEQFWAAHGTYTTDVSQLGMFGPKVPPTDSVWVQVLFAGGRSWNGRALYFGKLRKSCVVYIGALSDLPSPPVSEVDSLRASAEGLPACDKF